uniref:Nonstructural protein n=1 Tax=Dulem virus 129 TaxID=3145606 RepID=A0AAU8B1X4_9VIRU
MVFSVYSIRDFKSGFLAPTVEVNDAVAIRNFEHAVLNSEQSLFFSHPEDYALYLIGAYDADRGVLTPVSPVVELLTATQVFNRTTTSRITGGERDAADAL